MKSDSIIERILGKNPDFDRERIAVRMDRRIEYDCGHGIGHTIYSPNKDYIHGCDGCCENYTILIPEDLNSQE